VSMAMGLVMLRELVLSVRIDHRLIWLRGSLPVCCALPARV
jgi:hypothetical protein